MTFKEIENIERLKHQLYSSMKIQVVPNYPSFCIQSESPSNLCKSTKQRRPSTILKPKYYLPKPDKKLKENYCARRGLSKSKKKLQSESVNLSELRRSLNSRKKSKLNQTSQLLLKSTLEFKKSKNKLATSTTKKRSLYKEAVSFLK